MSGPNIKPILEGRKIQTRRIITEKHRFNGGHNPEVTRMWTWNPITGKDDPFIAKCPHGKPGERLWVKETFGIVEGAPYADGKSKEEIIYRADVWKDDDGYFKWKPSIFMPRWASRILLEITDVRAERLQDISEEDAKAEGCYADKPMTWWQGYMWDENTGDHVHQQSIGDEPPEWMIEPKKMAPKPWLLRTAKDHYRSLWEFINGEGSWDANPWVWCISFKLMAN